MLVTFLKIFRLDVKHFSIVCAVFDILALPTIPRVDIASIVIINYNYN